MPPLKKGVSFEEDKRAVFKNFRKGSKGLNIGKNCPFTTNFDCQFVDCCDLLTLLKGFKKAGERTYSIRVPTLLTNF